MATLEALQTARDVTGMAPPVKGILAAVASLLVAGTFGWFVYGAVNGGIGFPQALEADALLAVGAAMIVWAGGALEAGIDDGVPPALLLVGCAVAAAGSTIAIATYVATGNRILETACGLAIGCIATAAILSQTAIYKQSTTDELRRNVQVLPVLIPLYLFQGVTLLAPPRQALDPVSRRIGEVGFALAPLTIGLAFTICKRLRERSAPELETTA